ncbi:MAG: DUF116 domain-containing protein [Terracidiphilus sp.]
MQTPIQSEASLSEPGEVPATVAAAVYDLRGPDGSSARFYADLAAFCERLQAQAEERAGAWIRGYARFVREELGEAPRGAGDYSLELLTLGLAMARYAVAAEATPGWCIHLAQALYRLRSLAGWLKRPADWLRAALVHRSLLPHLNRPPSACAMTPDRLPRLIAWLRATGEFAQEADRLENWHRFLAQLDGDEAARCLRAAHGLFAWFEREAGQALGTYTQGVARFLAAEYAHRGCREDQLFCGKDAVHYHLGMVTAEIMNSGLRAEFDLTRRRVVLVPACMRGAHAADCRATVAGVEIHCAACTDNCTVNRITRQLEALGAEVYLVPHSSGFSRWLMRWQRTPGVGVTAVACLLNLLPGGYEMRARGIAAQCLPLDYPGCSRHWNRVAVATAVNEERLVRIAALPGNKALA